MKEDKYLFLIETAMRFVVWLFFVGGILMDALMLSATTKQALFWIPFVLMGFFFVWCIDGFIKRQQMGRLFFYIVPYFVLVDFVGGGR